MILYSSVSEENINIIGV